RTALFNYLFAKKNNGQFILRIEDTDIERSEEKYIQNIYDSLKSIGLDWDEGPDIGGKYSPYKQSERAEIYTKYAQKLVESGHTYYCWCSVEELEAEKEQARQEKRDFTYSGKCKNLSEEEFFNRKMEFELGERKPVIRFSVQSKKLKFHDLIKGELEFDTGLTGDFVVMKSNGTPTYNFAVVVDDIEMKISHVIRGEDHISNTPKQILIYEALGVNIPQFSHVGMILAPDKTKLSKRHGATAVSEFMEQGYLPEAFVNFLALLGWSPPDQEEVKSLDEIVKLFSLDRISPTPAIFEFDKLNWLNGVYIRTLPLDEITRRAKKYLNQYDLSSYSEKQLEIMVYSVRNNLTKMNQITDSVSYFFGEQVNIDKEIRETILNTDESQKVLAEFMKVIEFIEKTDYQNIEKINEINEINEMHEKLGEFRNQMKPLKPKQVMWAIRAALTGRVHGADMAVIIFLLGKDRVKLRIEHAILNTN
ncbi:MAG: glutamate--tRNA ligase, partial [Candidatus Aenigmarchaeota archaeon]|nr:glutamate--tRNA ligase [Candidatus Aenigmarchaeota archaeon]